MTADECLLCRVEDADAFFGRQRVREDDHWRVSVVLRGAATGSRICTSTSRHSSPEAR